jgi:hypothetical protein
MDHHVAAEHLPKAFGETLRNVVVHDGVALELWGNSRTGSWTVLITTTGGISCIAGSGSGFDMGVRA